MTEIPKLHPACEVWPPMAENDLAELAADIAKNGQREAIVLMPDGQMILDGRCRWLACARAGMTPTTRLFGSAASDGGDPYRFVISKNRHRRHLSYAEKCFAAEAIATMSDGGDRRSNNFSSSKEELKRLTRAEAAKSIGIGLAGIDDARTIRVDGDPELVARVKRGELPVRKTATRLRAQKNAAAPVPPLLPQPPRPQPRKLGHVLLERAARAAAMPELTLEEKGYPPPELAHQQHPEAPPGTTYAMKWREDNGRVQLWPLAEKQRLQLTWRYQAAIGQLAKLDPSCWPPGADIASLNPRQRAAILFDLRKVLLPLMPRLREWETLCASPEGEWPRDVAAPHATA